MVESPDLGSLPQISPHLTKIEVGRVQGSVMSFPPVIIHWGLRNMIGGAEGWLDHATRPHLGRFPSPSMTRGQE
jgi:hypothetical protein